MTPEQQRIAIAEACGWKRKESRELSCGIHDCIQNHFDWTLNGKSHGVFHFDENPLPDYPNDLNAMHEAEKILSSEQRAQGGPYEQHLRNVCPFEPWLSKAPQRAKAFLRTIGKWVEE